jgi:DHA2 family multidrug resistance protein
MANDSAERSAAGGQNPWLIAAIVSIATFMEVLDTSIANVALRHIAGSLSAGQDEATWVLSSYLISNAIVLPISGWLAQVIGRKRFYMSCVALFGLSSLLCALAPSLAFLIIARVLQGLGGGGLAPTEQSILADTFPPEQRGRAFAIYGVTVVVAPTMGPTLGGWLTDAYSWHWVFLINLPFACLSLFLVQTFLHEPKALEEERKQHRAKGLRIDGLGLGLIVVGLGSLQVVLDRGQQDDWFGSSFIVLFAVIATLSLLLLVAWEMTHPDPIVALPLLRERNFFAANVAMFVMGFTLFGTITLIPQLLQSNFGYDAMTAGLALTAGGFAALLMMPIAGILADKVDPRILVGFGLFEQAVTMWYASGLSPDAGFWDWSTARLLQAIGLPFVFVPITTIAYVGLPKGSNEQASPILNLMRNLGGSFGIAISQTLLAQRTQFHQARLIEHASDYEPSYREALRAITHMLIQQGRAAGDAARMAVAVFGQRMSFQASFLGYIDTFWLLGVATMLLLPIVFLLRKAPKNAKPAH